MRKAVWLVLGILFALTSPLWAQGRGIYQVVPGAIRLQDRWDTHLTTVTADGRLLVNSKITHVSAARTSAVGTGGTAAAYKSATIDVAGGNITPRDTNNSDPPAQITARHLPSGGATISEWISRKACFVEETNAGTHLCHGQTEVLYGSAAPIGQQYLTLREGQGLLVKQGSVASVNNIAFGILFSLE